MVPHSEIEALERAACAPEFLNPNGFNPRAIIPYGCAIDHIRATMQGFLEFLEFVNTQLNSRSLQRLETMLMPANFSSMVGEFCISTIPRYCSSLVKNQYHNGHPDLIPAQLYADNSVQYAHEGIEVKASRYMRGWQGHNAEASWLMAFAFSASRGTDAGRGINPRPFRFEGVFGAQLEVDDWTFSGRSETSRRTITASVNPTGLAKMTHNWIYMR